jgi:hypothetical protein
MRLVEDCIFLIEQAHIGLDLVFDQNRLYHFPKVKIWMCSNTIGNEMMAA